MPARQRPQAVVTDLGILEPDENGELILTTLHPGITRRPQVRANTGWELHIFKPDAFYPAAG